MFIKRILGSLVAASIIAGAIAGPEGKKNNDTATPDNNLAPIKDPKGSKVVEGSYIVVYKSDATLPKSDVTSQAIKKGLKRTYNFKGFKGFSGKFDDETLNKIRADPAVAFVERDGIMSINAEVQNGAPWGLARISHREKLNTNTQDKFIYDVNGGQGVTAYVIDTGILTNHPEFEGRARWGATFADDGDEDGNGHGTHVAGTIGSKTYGVAKKVKLVAVKVLGSDGTGYNSDIIAGINWAANDQKKNPKNKSVANLSLGGTASDAVDNAVKGAVAAGLHVVVAAGNSNSDACKFSPARESTSITVGGSDINDAKYKSGNYGKCVDIIAPAVNVLSTWNDGKTKAITGTSMATPHVAGIIAQFLTTKVRDPASMKEYITSIASKGKITGYGNDTVNLLAFNTLESAAQAA
ncbi:uncharacterized protein VTP21DRAFT_9077 [Calcarisporiella thermophila]|uniref:uncharacterized protein n=1 Tax=Calcarisporiella thermophila TaxID=911321 RepID=UPI003742A393